MRINEGDIVRQLPFHHALPEVNLGLGKVVELLDSGVQCRVRWQGGRLIYEWPATLKRVSPLVALAMQAPE